MFACKLFRLRTTLNKQMNRTGRRVYIWVFCYVVQPIQLIKYCEIKKETEMYMCIMTCYSV